MADALPTKSNVALEPVSEAELLDEREPTVFTVLAERARGHPASHLWGAALFGAADAAAILIAYPSAWWIASGALTLCAFGAWGLADGALVPDPYHPSRRPGRLTIRAIRASAVVLGVAGALGAVLGLIGASLGGLIH